MEDGNRIQSEREAAGVVDGLLRTSIRPSIWHVMMWTAFSAVLFALRRLLPDQESLDSVSQVLGIAHACLGGAVLTGTVLLISERGRRGAPLARQSGHWLLLIPAAAMCLFMPVVLFAVLCESTLVADYHTPFYLLLTAAVSVNPLLNVVAARSSYTSSWRVVFWCSALLSALNCLLYATLAISPFANYIWLFHTLPQWGLMAVAFVILLISMSEKLKGDERDWLHWTGVTTHILGNVVTALMAIT